MAPHNNVNTNLVLRKVISRFILRIPGLGGFYNRGEAGREDINNVGGLL